MKDKSCNALLNANKIGGCDVPPCIVKNSALPEVQKPQLAENSETGVSTSSAPSTIKHWYAMRTTYGREQKAYDFVVSNGGTAYLPLIKNERVINGKKTIVYESRIPNIFFVYGTEDEVKNYAFDNVHLPFHIIFSLI